MNFSHLLFAAFICWAPASLVFALIAGAALGRLREDEFSRDALVVAKDSAVVKAAGAHVRN